MTALNQDLSVIVETMKPSREAIPWTAIHERAAEQVRTRKVAVVKFGDEDYGMVRQELGFNGANPKYIFVPNQQTVDAVLIGVGTGAADIRAWDKRAPIELAPNRRYMLIGPNLIELKLRYDGDQA